MSSSSTLGGHIARRLHQLGITDIFTVPGDSNLTLLDYIVDEPGLNLIGCCNELNCGYAADGYSRSRGIGACIVTFTVGGLSIINAIAGAYSESHPIVCIVGGPNSDDYGTKNRILHHTIGDSDFSQELHCYKQVTACQVVIKTLDDAHEKFEHALAVCLRENKPVYISICCNLFTIFHSTFAQNQVPFCLSPKLSYQTGLEIAVEATAAFLNTAVKPILVAGPKIRLANACPAFAELAEACGYPFAVLSSAKGLVPEWHQNFIGTYWGPLSTPFCSEIVESADAYLFAGPIFDDITLVGNSLLIKKERAVIVQPERVIVPKGPSIAGVLMRDFLKALATKVKRNTTAHDNYLRIFTPEGNVSTTLCRDTHIVIVPLTVRFLFKHIHKMLSGETAVIAEAGDSWFNCQKLKLPEGCRYEAQMLYGSIGWSVGATLGYAQAAHDKRVIACIGDGSFQVGVQEISTMLRQKQNSIIFLINNGGYTTEVEIHDGPYNVIKNWDYCGVVNAISNSGEGKCWTCKVEYEEELLTAIEQTEGEMVDRLCFIEVVVDKDDSSKELLGLGTRLAVANSRQPQT